jgi:5S rRNA maturation endonuclease (ribonuclease M5)
MDLEKAQEMLELLGCEKFYVSEQETADGHRTLMRSNCPLSRFRHDKQEDRHPSFALIQKNGGNIKYNCMACNSDGSLIELFMTIKYEVKQLEKRDEKLERLLDKLSNEIKELVISDDIKKLKDQLDEITAPKKKRNDLTKIKENFACLPDEVAVRLKEMQDDLWRKQFVIDYLVNSRKLTIETLKDWGIGWAEEARRIIVPQYDTDKRLVNIGGRYLKAPHEYWSPNKWFHTKGFRREAFLFGEDRLTQQDGLATIYLVEGMFDAIYLSMKGIPNVMAILGTELAHIQAAKLNKWARNVIIVPDGDMAGQKSAKKIEKQLSIENVFIYPTQDGKDPDELTDSQIENLRTRYV